MLNKIDFAHSSMEDGLVDVIVMNLILRKAMDDSARRTGDSGVAGRQTSMSREDSTSEKRLSNSKPTDSYSSLFEPTYLNFSTSETFSTQSDFSAQPESYWCSPSGYNWDYKFDGRS
jgi:hypothetical protein